MADPFFIVGCGRSGTSLLRMLLNNHRDIAIPLEALFIVDYLRVSRSSDLQSLKGYLVREPEILEWGISPSLNDLSTCSSVADCIAKLHELYAAAKGKPRWGQKTPRFVRHMELLSDHFAHAKFIHLVRDPRAVVNSLVHSDVHRSDAFHAASRWRMDVACGLAFEAENPGKVLRITYENLVVDQVRSMQQAIDFLDLESSWEAPSSSRAGAGEYSEFYGNIHANLDRAPSAEFVDKWKKTLTDREVEVTEAVCSGLMKELGYEPLLRQPSLDPWDVRWMKAQRLARLPLQAARYIRFRRRYLAHLIWRKWKLGLLKEFLWSINY